MNAGLQIHGTFTRQSDVSMMVPGEEYAKPFGISIGDMTSGPCKRLNLFFFCINLLEFSANETAHRAMPCQCRCEIDDDDSLKSPFWEQQLRRKLAAD